MDKKMEDTKGECVYIALKKHCESSGIRVTVLHTERRLVDAA